MEVVCIITIHSRIFVEEHKPLNIKTLKYFFDIINYVTIKLPCWLVEHDVRDIFNLTSLVYCLGHFLGNGSVIDILRSKGHNVTHIRSDDSLPR